MGWNNIPPNGFPQIPDIEDLEAVVNDVAGLKTGKVNKADIAPAFSAEGNYSVGDLVYHEGTLYKCTTAHEAAAWNAEHFTATTIEAEIAELQGDVSDLGTTKANQITIAPTFSAETAYEAGDLVYYNGLTYRCTNDHEGAWDAADFSATTIAGELDTLKSGLTDVNSKFTGVARGYELTGQSFTLGNGGYLLFNLPSELVGKTILSISCSNFATAQKPPYAWAFLPSDNHYILYGEANEEYTNATIDFVYM